MNNELLYCGIENWTPCSYSSLYLSIVLSFTAKFVSQFSPELCKLESSNMVYICRMSDCIVGLRLRVMALIFLRVFLPTPDLNLYDATCSQYKMLFMILEHLSHEPLKHVHLKKAFLSLVLVSVSPCFLSYLMLFLHFFPTEVEDVVSTTLFLLSEQSSMVSGIIMPVDVAMTAIL